MCGSAKVPGKYFPFQKEKSNGSGEGSDRFYATVLAPQRPLSIEFAVFDSLENCESAGQEIISKIYMPVKFFDGRYVCVKKND